MSRLINRVACQLPKMANATGCEFRPIFFEAHLLYSKGRVNATGNLHGLKLLPGEGPQSACVGPPTKKSYYLKSGSGPKNAENENIKQI